MHITLRLYGNLKRYSPDQKDRTEIEKSEGTTIRQLLEQLGVPESGWWMAALNDQVVDAETALHEGDLLEVFDPVGGGADPFSHAPENND